LKSLSRDLGSLCFLSIDATPCDHRQLARSTLGEAVASNSVVNRLLVVIVPILVEVVDFVDPSLAETAEGNLPSAVDA
jgi:hypothetical protein